MRFRHACAISGSFWAVSNIASPPAEGLQLKPRHRQIDASNHRECGNDTYPPGPHGLGPATGQQRSSNAEHGCSNRGRGDPAVPVYRRRKEPQRGVGHVSCMVRPRKYRYTVPPSSAETAYRTTTALANEADGTERKRPKNEPGRACVDAHAAKVWCVIAPSNATATKP